MVVPVVISSASIIGPFRYSLTRVWDPGRPHACWIMCNPSIADADTDDHTISRVRYYTEREELGGFTVVNLFAFRATDPADLLTAPDPVGPYNQAWIHHELGAASPALIVAAWGANPAKLETRRAGLRDLGYRTPADIARLVEGLGGVLRCLGRTVDGAPRHPARLGNDVPLEVWTP